MSFLKLFHWIGVVKTLKEKKQAEKKEAEPEIKEAEAEKIEAEANEEKREAKPWKGKGVEAETEKE